MKRHPLRFFDSLMALLFALPFLTTSIACYIIKMTVWTVTSIVYALAVKFKIVRGLPCGFRGMVEEWQDEWEHAFSRYL